MKGYGVIVLAGCAWVLGSGCAGLLNKGRQSLLLESTPPGATVTVNGAPRGETPLTYHYRPDDGPELNVEFQLAGHQLETFLVRPRESAGVLLADAMLLHVPFLVDHRSAARYRLPVAGIHANLYREARPDMTRYLVPITALRTALGERPDLGTANGSTLRLERDGPFRELLAPDMLANAVQAGARNTWLDVRTARLGSARGDEAVQRAKLHLRPEITAVQGRLTKRQGRYHGPVELAVDWHFHSSARTDSLLFTVPMRTTYHAAADPEGDLVNRALAHAARLLADDMDLHARLGEHYHAGLARTKGAAVELATPTPIAYNGRREMFSALVNAVATVQAGDGHGSGFVISHDGHLITNAHVVGREPVVKVRFGQGFSLDAQVLKVNTDFDLALLKVPATDLPALTIGDDQALMLGEELHAIGTPVDAALGQSIARGILSGMRQLEGRTYIQTDVSINPGNSGGPLIDADGRVVGVTTMKIGGSGLEGLGFAVPISVALEMLNIRMTP
ncbi:MAG: trypsin-like peptidase domain-containing protein [Flavobacteriales bacterium]|jgi:hypothetical protein|nr:trypsin-like peptidase domain-containing protein [Flavobacteriales bacterium]